MNPNLRDYYFEHKDVLEQIYQHLRPTCSLSKYHIHCPCGSPRPVKYTKLKQHICTKNHRKVFPIPYVKDFE